MKIWWRNQSIRSCTMIKVNLTTTSWLCWTWLNGNRNKAQKSLEERFFLLDWSQWGRVRQYSNSKGSSLSWSNLLWRDGKIGAMTRVQLKMLKRCLVSMSMPTTVKHAFLIACLTSSKTNQPLVNRQALDMNLQESHISLSSALFSMSNLSASFVETKSAQAVLCLFLMI